MTSAELRQSFLDFFYSKQHTIVASSSLLPDSPNLLFTNAGMNQFVPLFLGKSPCSFTPARATNSQKCIRAGGKHNDLEEVGLDTYHHTFFEMLGNWSFGDYFKKEAIDWAWELMVEIWKFPPQRLYATVYKPAPGDPAAFDQEAYDLWSTLFIKAGLDPAVHIVPGNRKDNFWMMGETGPCGPCSELHVDLTPYGDTRGMLVNKGTAECIEIWNLVFIQFNATVEGNFLPLQQRHVDTGMGFERLCSIMQTTRGFTEFGNVIISNYETDLFRPIFTALEKMSGARYASTLPQRNNQGELIAVTEHEKIDVAFRVIADHLRTLSFAIADGISPGNNDRNYVLRRILRRAVRYGRTLGFQKPFLYELAPLLASLMGDAFPEVRKQEAQIALVLRREEEAFHKTLDKGLALFETEAAYRKGISGAVAFRLYDEQGFPFDLTELLAREHGLSVDGAGFEKLMEEQRQRARAAQKKEIITVSAITTTEPTEFLGFDQNETPASVLEIISLGGRTALIFDHSVCYAEMGGQVGDTGTFHVGEIGLLSKLASTDKVPGTEGAQPGSVDEVLDGANTIAAAQFAAEVEFRKKPVSYTITNTQKQGDVWLHFLEGNEVPELHAHGILKVTSPRRAAIERHHSVTHLLHWALHEIVGKEVTQKGSFVGEEKLTFDFNSTPLTTSQIEAVERLVNEEIVKNHSVSWQEMPYKEVKKRPEIMQFFGDKYGERVRVVQIGGIPGALDGFSMELCGGTHVRDTGEIGQFRIVSEGAVAAGIRRIEAVAGLAAHAMATRETALLHSLAAKLRSPLAELEKKIDTTLTKITTLEKEYEDLHQQMASATAMTLLSQIVTLGITPTIIAIVLEADSKRLQGIVKALQEKFQGVILLAGIANNAVALMATVSADFRKTFPAAKLIQEIVPLVGGKGGGSPESARGAGPNVAGLNAALEKARAWISKQ